MQKIIHSLLVLMLANPAFAQNEAATDKSVLQTSIQNELICFFCGCNKTIHNCLGSMTCSESKALSKQISALLESGKSKPEILQAMVAQYGERILAAPTKTGFNLTAWILPFVALLIGGLIVARVVTAWKKQTKPQTKIQAQAPQQAEEKSSGDDPYTARLERELREFDR